MRPYAYGRVHVLFSAILELAFFRVDERREDFISIALI
jgi:hypothetical protein